MDENYWYKENITALCTTACDSALRNWLSNVQTSCSSDTVVQGGMLVQAKAIPLQYTYGYSLACLQNK
jgi:hypothetical protein